jgi:sugar phosphate isomerase/epimerase
MKDAILYFVSDGLERQLRPCGGGIIDWPRVLAILAAHDPDLHLSIEAPAESLGHIPMHIYLAQWQAGHPDLTVAEFAEIVRLARRSEELVAAGTIPPPAPLRDHSLSDQEKERFITESAAYLRHLVAQVDERTTAGKQLEPTPQG